MNATLPPSRRLLDWYDRNRRDLPWRRDRDPYRIWISEVMLQQTQVATVLPYYHEFLERFPDLQSLADADIEEVLAAWTGLGYYRRARHLHAAAREMVKLGGFPTHSRELLALPGIGDYTAAAVASMAFGEKIAVLDGNVERVLTRWLALAGDPKRASGRRRLRATATDMLEPERPGDGNQALMELGATVCRPREPECHRCPLAVDCRARQQGNPTDYPPPRQRRAIEKHHLAVAVVRRGDKLLMFRRGETEELMPGLWELPNRPFVGPRRTQSAPTGHDLVELGRRFGEHYGGRWALASAVTTVRHAITHRSFRVAVHPAEVHGTDRIGEGPAARWIDTVERGHYATSSLVEKVLTAIDVLDPEDRTI